MIRTIEIQNYRCFEKQRVEGCRRLNLIVGDNGAGKTTLLEAIFLALAASPEVAMRYRQSRGLDTGLTGSSYAIEEAIWRDFFFRREWGRVIEVSLTGDGPDSRNLQLFRGVGQQVFAFESKEKDESDYSAAVTFQWTDQEGKRRTQIPRVTPKGMEFPIPTEDAPSSFMFPATQSISSGETAGRFSALRRAGRADEFAELLVEEYPWIRGLDIEVDAGSPILYAKLRGDSESRQLANISGGINRTIAILLAIAYRNGSVTVVDEFESGLFYTHHKAVWRTVLSALRRYGGQLFATTHSGESLRALVQAAGEQVDDISLWRLERSETGSPVLLQFEGDTLKDALEFGAEARGM